MKPANPCPPAISRSRTAGLGTGQRAACRRRSVALALGAVSFAAAVAAAPAGRVEFVFGEVSLLRGGAVVPAAKGTEILEGDTVQTGRTASAQLRMKDNAFVTVRPNSALRIDQYRSAAQGDGANQVSVGLVSGTFRSFTGAIGKAQPEAVRYVTPTATIGIRGTGNVTSLAPGGATYNYTITGQHAVSSQNAAGQVQTVLTQPGQTVEVRPGQAPRVVPTPPALIRQSSPPRGGEEDSGSTSSFSQTLVISPSITLSLTAAAAGLSDRQSTRCVDCDGALVAGTAFQGGGSGATGGTAQDDPLLKLGEARRRYVAHLLDGGANAAPRQIAEVGIDRENLAQDLDAIAGTPIGYALPSSTSGAASRRQLVGATAANGLRLAPVAQERLEAPNIGSSGLAVGRVFAHGLEESGVQKLGADARPWSLTPFGDAGSFYWVGVGSPGATTVPPSALRVADFVRRDPTSSALTGYETQTLFGYTGGRFAYESVTFDGDARVDGAVSGSTAAAGTWRAGEMRTTLGWGYGSGLSVPWYTINEPGPVYATQILTGTSELSPAVWTRPLAADGTSGALRASALRIDFTRQTVSTRLEATVGAVGWLAQVTDAPLGRDGSFAVTAPAGCGNCALSVSRTLGTQQAAAGSLQGRLGGVAAESAALAYEFHTVAGAWDSLQGAVGYTTPRGSHDATAARRTVLLAGELGPWDAAAGRREAAVLAVEAAAARVVEPSGAAIAARVDAWLGQAGAGDRPVTLTSTGPGPVSDGTAAGLNWGRWATAEYADRAGGTAASLGGVLHVLTGPVQTALQNLPQTGTAEYRFAGGTLPTGAVGQTGTLEAATLRADFTRQTVDASVTASVSGARLNAQAAAMPLRSGAFEAASAAGTLAVACTGACPAGAGSGTLAGRLIGATGEAAAFGYTLKSAGSAPASAQGLTVFTRP